MWRTLVQNVSVLLAIIVVYSVAARALWRRPGPLRVLVGVLFGGVAVLGMLNPAPVAPGVFFDARSVVLSAAGLVGGPVVAGMAAAVVGTVRLAMGGTGALTGALVALVSAGIGAGYHVWARDRPGAFHPLRLYAVGLVVHGALIGCMLTLPDAVRWSTIDAIALPVLTVFPVATVVFTLLLHDVDRRREAEAHLASSEARFRQIAEHLDAVIFLADLDRGALLYVNPACEAVLGESPEALVAQPTLALDRLHPADRVEIVAAMAGSAAGHAVDVACRVVGPDGATRHLRGRVFPYDRGEGRVRRIAGLVEDVTGRRAAEHSLRLAQAVFEGAGEAIVVLDADGRVQAANAAFERLSGYAPADVIGQPFEGVRSPRHAPAFYAHLQAALEAHGSWHGEIYAPHVDGEARPVWAAFNVLRDPDGGAVRSVVALMTDLSEVKASEARLRHVTYHDALTGLPNRQLADRLLGRALDAAARGRHRVGVLHVGLDRFKKINESMGHPAADAVLKAVAARLQAQLAEGDHVARVGGDEFVVVLAQVPDDEAAVRRARRLLEIVAEPIDLPGGSAFVTASAGVSLFPDHARDVRALLRDADAALHRAKLDGPNRVRPYRPGMTSTALMRLNTEQALHQALLDGGRAFELHYQPQFNLVTGRVVGVEALVRWRRDGELVPPDAFVPVAEETALIGAIGRHVLRAACVQGHAWLQAGADPAFKVGVNLSARQLAEPGLVDEVARTLAESGLPPANLELEITETVVMARPEAAAHTLDALSRLGVRVAVDDFGTGYSSMAYLKRFAVDSLKIDRAFIPDSVDDHDAVAICRAIIALAHSLRLSVVAEGVETEAQRALLEGAGCEVAQGFLFARPMPADEAEAFVLRRKG